MTGERFESIDFVRGAALLGILVMNIMMFAMPGAASYNPLALGDRGRVDFAIWLFSHLFFDQKFMTIFSMLFGAGIVLMAARVEQRGGRPAVTHYRRMLALWVFGLIHAYLIWDGDILALYAVCGAIVYPFRRLRPAALIATGLVFLLIGSAIFLAIGILIPQGSPDVARDVISFWSPSDQDIRDELAAYGGTWLSAFHWRAIASFEFHVIDILVWGLWRASGNMLLGMAMLKLGVLTAERATSFYRRTAIAGFAIGVPVVAFGAHQMHIHAWEGYFSFFIAGLFNYWASIVIACGWIGVLILARNAPALARLKPRVIAVGRSAFSCYILTSLLCTWIFYGYGLGLFGRVGRPGQLAITVAVWTVLLIIAPAWLNRFRQGPLEWLWRACTYGRPLSASTLMRHDRSESPDVAAPQSEQRHRDIPRATE